MIVPELSGLIDGVLKVVGSERGEHAHEEPPLGLVIRSPVIGQVVQEASDLDGMRPDGSDSQLLPAWHVQSGNLLQEQHLLLISEDLLQESERAPGHSWQKELHVD